MAFNKMRFHENAFPRKAFQRNAFHEIQEKHNGKKQGNLGYSLFSVGRIARQQLLDISQEQMTNNIDVYIVIDPPPPTQLGCICSSQFEPR